MLLDSSEQSKQNKISLLVTDVEEMVGNDRVAHRLRANSDEIVEGSPRARRMSAPNIGQDQPPTINLLDSNTDNMTPLLDNRMKN